MSATNSRAPKAATNAQATNTTISGHTGSTALGALNGVADVVEEIADHRAEEEKCRDDDDRDQRDEQAVLNEGLAPMRPTLSHERFIAR
jgi:hypothetical protein